MARRWGGNSGKYYLKEELEKGAAQSKQPNTADGSIIIVIATDAPVDHRNLKRLAARSMLGLGADRCCRHKWQWRLCDRIFDRAGTANSQPSRYQAKTNGSAPVE